jgi:hypothetical protein
MFRQLHLDVRGLKRWYITGSHPELIILARHANLRAETEGQLGQFREALLNPGYPEVKGKDA